jgi:chromate transporter
MQSFGGGASTTFLIQRAFIERNGWVTDAEFLRMWNLCQLTPGISLIALTALLGKELRGARGVAISLAGMLLPSGAITCLLAALFVAVERSAITQALLRGIIPATGGIMMLVLYNFARPLVRENRHVGLPRGLAYIALTLLGAVLVIAFNVSAIVVMLGFAILGAVVFSPRSKVVAPPAAPPAAPPVEIWKDVE